MLLCKSCGIEEGRIYCINEGEKNAHQMLRGKSEGKKTRCETPV
jgi:hypothetical protein